MANWQTECPKEEGFWWFYGKLTSPKEKNMLYLVDVSRIADKLDYHLVDTFLSLGTKVYEGKWLKVGHPVLPTEKGVR